MGIDKSRRSPRKDSVPCWVNAWKRKRLAANKPGDAYPDGDNALPAFEQRLLVDRLVL
jgi:hypothetical protein